MTELQPGDQVLLEGKVESNGHITLVRPGSTFTISSPDNEMVVHGTVDELRKLRVFRADIAKELEATIGNIASDDDPIEMARCTSCDHQMRFHQADGCWFTVENGRGNLVCVCRVAYPKELPLEAQLKSNHEMALDLQEAIGAVIGYQQLLDNIGVAAGVRTTNKYEPPSDLRSLTVIVAEMRAKLDDAERKPPAVLQSQAEQELRAQVAGLKKQRNMAREELGRTRQAFWGLAADTEVLATRASSGNAAAKAFASELRAAIVKATPSKAAWSHETIDLIANEVAQFVLEATGESIADSDALNFTHQLLSTLYGYKPT